MKAQHQNQKAQDFIPDSELLQWVENSQLLFQSTENYNTHALLFWGHYTQTLMQRLAHDPESLALMKTHLAEFQGERRAA